MCLNSWAWSAAPKMAPILTPLTQAFDSKTGEFRDQILACEISVLFQNQNDRLGTSE